jgi:NAD(P)-dependent dehydrogenase (short-subunit alcohol dehydrogenase family)
MAGKWTAADIPSQAGKLALVTGANSGVGFHAARHLALAGAAVILAGRDPQKVEAARQRILGDSPKGEVYGLTLDLANLQSVRTAAEQFLSGAGKLDLLINNAGVMAYAERRVSADGFELQWATNHLGHFALTGLLLPTVLAAPAARVVTVASIAHKRGTIHFDDLNSEKSYSPMGAYQQTKLANLLFGFELERRLRKAGARASSIVVHPGVSATNIFNAGAGSSGGLRAKVIQALLPVLGQSEEQGSLPTLYGAVSPDAEGGHYYGPDGFLEIKGYPVEVEAKPQAKDEAAAAKLWAISEQATGVKYVFAAPGAMKKE